jgi:poly-gamma-glutamate capsule biosynthesis protein CapA/YwtB (metallophosphatase superfamily)
MVSSRVSRRRRRLAGGVVAGAASLAVGACGSASAGGNSVPAAAGSTAQSSADTTSVSTASTAPAKAMATTVIRISAVGDTILGDTPSLPPDPRGYLAAVDKTLKGRSQIVFGNLEGTLTTVSSGKCGGHNGGNCFAFRNPPHYARYLAADGFTLLNDANNHSHDFGQAGLDQTIRAIHKAGMKQTGLPGQVTVVHAGSVKVAFVAFAPYSNTADLLHLHAAADLIRAARREARVVVVYMHAGAEGSDADHVTGHEEFYVGEDRGNPEKFAHMAIRNGASLVIASGPHVVRGMQFYRHHLIAYSLGNFANFHNFGGGGILSDSAILHVSLTASGAFSTGRLVSVQLDSSGHPTRGGGTVALVRKLSKEDFGGARAHFSAKGTISPPG